MEDELHEDFRDDFAVDAAKAAADIDTNGGGGAQQQQYNSQSSPQTSRSFNLFCRIPRRGRVRDSPTK